MSLYNLIFGRNDKLEVILGCVLGFNIRSRIPRYRNVFLEGSDVPVNNYDFLIYTRMGGGNYECWEEGEEDCTCPACELHRIEKDSWYITGYDDDFDCTYRTLVGKFTPEQKDLFNQVFKEGNINLIENKARELYPELFTKEDKND